MDRVLVFSPHPDDVEIFLGGTFLKHLKEGSAVEVVMMTYGEKSSLVSLLGEKQKQTVKQMRIEEMRRRFQLVPSVKVVFMGLPDRGVRQTEQTIVQALNEFERFKPSCAYLPESTAEMSYYSHLDHLETGRIAESAAARYSDKVRLRYFHSKKPNTYIDMSAFHETNLKALHCYKSQYQWHTGLPFLLHLYDKVRTRRTRAWGQRAGSEFAEAFREK